MPSRRALVHQHYRSTGPASGTTLEGLSKSAAAADVYAFRGDTIEFAVVVRVDLNGYSSWARGRAPGDRVELLDSFFSGVVPILEQHGGIYFRDEGDCIVCLFSNYFQTSATDSDVVQFARRVTGLEYGRARLSPKASVACGDVAFFQKSHERGTEEWSAEGEPFVRAARLEQSVQSKQRVHYFAEEYDKFFVGKGSVAPAGARYHWDIERDSVQVSGLALRGGWTSLVYETFIPGGRVD